jgi:hypothetical protein
MRIRRSTIARRIVPVLALNLTIAAPGGIWARPVATGDWEPTALAGEIVGAQTPASGPLFASVGRSGRTTSGRRG